MAAQRLGPALLDGAHGRQMAGQHAWSVLVSIGWSIFTEDVGQFYHIISCHDAIDGFAGSHFRRSCHDGCSGPWSWGNCGPDRLESDAD
jgi:hypothetical protein